MSKDARVPLDLRYSELPDHQSKISRTAAIEGEVYMLKNSVYFLFLLLVACSPSSQVSRTEQCNTECQLRRLYKTQYNAMIASQRLAFATQKVRNSESNDFMNATKKNDVKFIALVKGKVSETMKDPDSTQFKDLSVVRRDGGIWVCGSVNAKNSYGAYIGFEPFFATSLDVVLPLSGGHSNYANEVAISSYREWCSN